MSNWPFRFVHAGDFHLEQPPQGVAEVPEHLGELFLEAPYWAARRVFDAVLAEEADFLVLSGDVLSPQQTGPRGPLFLAEQFGRLAEREIPVYWAGGRVDPPEAWPSAVSLPENVHCFAPGHPGEFVHQRDATPLARLIGVSRGRQQRVRSRDFDPDPAGLFSIAVVYGTAAAETLAAQGIHYWALGGRHDRSTLLSAPVLAHYPGTPQGRRPEESGAHGCTLVQVDQQSQARTTLLPTDVVRWLNERVVVDEGTSRDDLETLLRERMQTLTGASPGVDLLVSWTIAGSGPLLGQLRRGTLAAELLDWLRQEYGFGPPAAWSLALEVELPASLPPEWYEQETLRGDFLRAIRQLQTDPAESLGLESYLAEGHLAGTLGPVTTIAEGQARGRVLREAAWLGVDLLSGEEPQS